MNTSSVATPPTSPLISQLAEVKGVLAYGTSVASSWLDPLRRKAVSPALVRELLSQYFFVNREFVLGIIEYSGRLAAALHDQRFEDAGMTREELEEVIATVVKISADECQAGDMHSGKNMHHNLLMRMGPRVGLTLSDVQNAKQSPTTASLVLYISNQFRDNDLFLGLSLVSAVEGVALPMVKALRELMGEFDSPDHCGEFTDEELCHLDLHIELEVEHAKESSAVYERVSLNPTKVRKLTTTATGLYRRFDTFWHQFA